MSDELEQDDPTYNIIIVGEQPPAPQRMIIVKVLECGDIHAENDAGEMIIIRADGTVQTYLEEDTNWVKGKISNPGMAWEVIGYHFGLTAGHMMERTRNEQTH